MRLPPLRARPEDIPPLAKAFAAAAARQVKKRDVGLSPGALERLAAHDWPGNVRELRNVIERAVLLAPGAVVRAADVVVGLPGESAAPSPVAGRDARGGRPRGGGAAGEAARIRRALDETGGDKPRAAEELGVNVRRLVQRMKELGL